MSAIYWTDERLITAALTQPLTPERLEKVRKRCQSPEQWARVQAALKATEDDGA